MYRIVQAVPQWQGSGLGALYFFAGALACSVAVAGPPAQPPAPIPAAVPSPTPAQAAATKAATAQPFEVQEAFGRSVQGRPLVAYILGSGRDVTMILGAFHGNETATPGVVARLWAYLWQHQALLRGRRVVLVPVVNPDGLRALRRVNAHGVDLNRNFPGSWQPRPRGARYNPGPRPASEPESLALIRLLDKYRPARVVSLHQPFHLMNPSGSSGLQLALLMQKFNHYPIASGVGYPTPGSFGHYCGKVRQVALVTLELSRASAATGWLENERALLAAITTRDRGNPATLAPAWARMHSGHL